MANYFLRITWFPKGRNEVKKILERHFVAGTDPEASSIAMGIWQRERQILLVPGDFEKYDTESALFKQIPYP